MMYIAFEGIDGSGKSRQVSMLCSWLERNFYTGIRLAEPTFGRHGRILRELLSTGAEMSIDEQSRLFTADRREHVKRKIRPLLEFVQKNESFIIVQDRSYLSAPAYQARGQQDLISILREQQAFAPKPDIFFLLDIPVEIAMERLRGRGGPKNIFERSAFLKEVRERYNFLAEQAGERIQVLDASESAESVFGAVRASLNLKSLEMGQQ